MLYFVQDEKLQYLLGYFQKKFEGEISAENLGKRNISCHPICSIEFVFLFSNKIDLLLLYWLMQIWFCATQVRSMGDMVHSCPHTHIPLWSCLNLEALQFLHTMAVPLDHHACQWRYYSSTKFMLC